VFPFVARIPWLEVLEDQRDLAITEVVCLLHVITRFYTLLHARASYYTPYYKVCNKSPENHAYYTFITHCYTVKDPWGYVTLITLFITRCYTLLHVCYV